MRSDAVHNPTTVGEARPRPTRPAWLLPALAAALLATALVLAGVVSASTVLSFAAFGGMMLMHLGGHGHGGHGSGRIDGHGGVGQDLSPRSDHSQPALPDSRTEGEASHPEQDKGSGTTHDDEHGAHACH